MDTQNDSCIEVKCEMQCVQLIGSLPKVTHGYWKLTKIGVVFLVLYYYYESLH